MDDASRNNRYLGWTLWGRFALALVSERAAKCPNRACHRRKRCLARFRPGDNYHRPAGSCPIMTAAEWRSVSLGMRGSLLLLQPWLGARQDEREAEEEAREKAEGLSREERIRRWRSPEAEAKRREEEKRRLSGPGHEYACLLWMRGEGEHLWRPRDYVEAGEDPIAWKVRHGCICARAGRLDCEDEEECFRRVSGASGGVGSGD